MRISLCFFMVSIIFVACSPEYDIKSYLDSQAEDFEKSDMDIDVTESVCYLYNTLDNDNFLANERIREVAISYATYLGFAESERAKARKFRSSTKLDNNYNPNWFNDAKIADKTAIEYDSLAEREKCNLIQTLDSVKNICKGGIWAYHEITYKEYVYRYYAGPYVKRRLYLFSDNGENVLWSNDVRFSEEELIKILNITKTNYVYNSDSDISSKKENEEHIIIILATIVLSVFLCIYFFRLWNKSEKNKVEKRFKNEEKEKIRAEERAKEKAELERVMQERENEFGTLTKELKIRVHRKNNIFIYEKAKTIFMDENKYSFVDILSCTIEKHVVKGVERHTTTPDKGEMAVEQVLWGMGKQYNVKSHTVVERTPDKVSYKVYIGINSLTTPQLSYTFTSEEKAHELCNIMNVIINSNKNE